jgi:hypothetical protein
LAKLANAEPIFFTSAQDGLIEAVKCRIALTTFGSEWINQSGSERTSALSPYSFSPTKIAALRGALVRARCGERAAFTHISGKTRETRITGTEEFL